MLDNIFIAMLITSFVGTISAIGITIIKPITRRFFSTDWHYYIWLVVLATMVIPFRFAIPQNDNSSKFKENVVLEENFIDDSPVLEFLNNDDSLQEMVETDVVENEISNIEDFVVNKMSVLSTIWILGVGLLFLFKMLSYIVFVLKLKKDSKIISCPEVKQYTDKKIITRMSSKVSSPLMLGVIRPTLILPEIVMTTEQLDSVLSHEMMHFKRKDILYKWFVCLVKCLHWFNPMVYYVAKQVDIECEISCDLAVVKNMNEEQEISYIDTILALVTAKKQHKSAVTTAMAGDKKSLKRRFSMIKNKGKVSKKAVIISVIIALVILAGCTFASGILNGKYVNNYENELLAVNTDTRQSDDFNFLLLGLDKQDKADTIMILSVKDEELLGISIPRDTIFMLDGEKATANEILRGENGDQKLVDCIKATMSMPINYYAKVNLSAIETLIDNVGGLDFNVPMDMEYNDPEQNLRIKLKQGRHTLNGAGVCGLLQFRRSNNGNGYNETTRIEVGQQVIEEFISQKLNYDFASKTPEMFKILADNIETNYPIANLASDIKLIYELKSRLTFKTISGASITDDTGFILYEEESGEVISAVTKPKSVAVTHNESKTQPETKVKLKRPCNGTITNRFGKRVHPITNEEKMHNGIDIKAPEGTEVVSSIIGTVTDVGFDAEKGNYIVVEKGNVKTIYAQLSATNVKKGDKININQSIGAVGSTGNSTGAHLHFEVMIDGEYVDPENLMP